VAVDKGDHGVAVNVLRHATFYICDRFRAQSSSMMMVQSSSKPFKVLRSMPALSLANGLKVEIRNLELG
jgi:hypothetical protein